MVLHDLRARSKLLWVFGSPSSIWMSIRTPSFISFEPMEMEEAPIITSRRSVRYKYGTWVANRMGIAVAVTLNRDRTRRRRGGSGCEGLLERSVGRTPESYVRLALKS